MRRFTNIRTITAAVSASLILALTLSSSAAAFALIKQSGQTGDWGTRSSTKGPEAKCGYTSPFSANPNLLHWLKVFPVLAGPATGSSQTVSWTVSIQRSKNNGSTWKTIATAKTQTSTATSTSSAKFKTVTVNVSGNLGERFRALSTIRWLHNGSTSGLVKMRMTTYGLQLGSAQSETVLDDYCDGQLLT